MTSRNRTEEFMQLRSLRAPRGGETDQLLGPRVTVPPPWVDSMAQVRDLEIQITTHQRQLEELHSTHLQVRFGPDRDADAEERNIEAIGTNITRLFKQAEAGVKNFETVYRNELGDDGGSDGELSIMRNVKMCLANELAGIGKTVRDAQRRYLKALEKKNMVRDRFAGGARQREVEESMARESMMDEYLRRGCTQEQIESIMLNNNLIDQRDVEVQSILTSIKALNEMFQDLHSMVVEQGTLLDRVDYNMTVTHERIVAGRKELQKAAKHQEAGTFLLCVMLLCVLIVGFILAIAVKVIL